MLIFAFWLGTPQIIPSRQNVVSQPNVACSFPFVIAVRGISIDIKESCSQHFTFEMLFHCGETWQRIQCPNLPEQSESWLAYRELATHILDPLVETFGHPLLTYGFCGVTLRKAILSNASPV